MSDHDPAVRTWQDATEAAMAQSTSALGRSLQTQLDQLRTEYNALLLERDKIGAQLCEALDANTALAFDHAKALLANDRLTRQLAELEQEKARARQLAAEYRAGGM